MPDRANKESLQEHRQKIAEHMHESTERAESHLRRWCQGEKLPLVSPEAKATKAAPLRKSA